MLHLRLGCLNSRPIRLSSFVIEVLARKCSSFLKNPDLETAWKKSGEHADPDVSTEMLALPEKSRYCCVTHPETTPGKSQEKMGIEVLARKYLPFLKNLDSAV
jgi:hypothetical protein